jgi:hypothetical protein
LLAHAAGGSASEDLSHFSNLLSMRDERSIERRYTGSKLLLNTIRTMKKLLVVLVVALVGCGGSAATTPKRAPAAMTHRCTTSGLAVWLGVGEGGAAAGSTYYPLEFTNTSNHRCRLFGFPGVSAVSSRQLGSPAQRNRAHPTHTVNLKPGATAHTVLQVVDVGNFPAARCKPAEASGLRVYPPGQLAAAEIPFSFRGCSAKGPIFLSVQPIQPGVGIPG